MNSSGTKTGLFLIELIVALLLFAFCAAICMQLFVAARDRTRDSDNLSQGVYIATSAAECYKASGGSLEAVQKLMGGELYGMNMELLVVFYNRDWERTEDVGAFGLSVLGTDDLGVAEIRVLELGRDENGELSPLEEDARLIYSITVKAVINVA